MAKVNITKRTVKKANQFTLENLNNERAWIEGKDLFITLKMVVGLIAQVKTIQRK